MMNDLNTGSIALWEGCDYVDPIRIFGGFARQFSHVQLFPHEMIDLNALKAMASDTDDDLPALEIID